MSKIELTDEQCETLGIELVELLGLRKLREEKGRYFTSWGSKTPMGLGKCLVRLLNETVVQQPDPEPDPGQDEELKLPEGLSSPSIFYRITGVEEVVIDFFQAVEVSGGAVRFRGLASWNVYPAGETRPTGTSTCAKNFSEDGEVFWVAFEQFDKVRSSDGPKVVGFYYNSERFYLWNFETVPYPSSPTT